MLDAVVTALDTEFHDPGFRAERWPPRRDAARSPFAACGSDEERLAVVRELPGSVGVSHLQPLPEEAHARVDEAEADPRRLKPVWRRDGPVLWVAVRSRGVPRTRTTSASSRWWRPAPFP